MHPPCGAAKMLLFICGMSVIQPLATSPIKDAIDIIKLIQYVSSSFLEAWQLLGRESLDSAGYQNQIIKSIGEINDQIRRMEEAHAEHFELTIEMLKRDFFTESLLVHRISYVDDITRSISQRYQDFIDYQKYKSTVNLYTLRSFAKWNIKPGPSAINVLLDTLYNYFYVEAADEPNTSLYSKLVARYVSNVNLLCTLKRSPQQFAFDLYTKSMLIEIKGYTMLEFSWMIMHDSSFGNFSQEQSLIRDRYKQRMLRSEQLVRQVMAHTERVYWRCDPDEHVLGKTFDEVTRLMQGYVENEINISPESNCFQTCDDYQNARVLGCEPGSYCEQQPKCAGRVHSCRFIESAMHVCPANEGSSRRYILIASDSGRVLGAGAGSRDWVCLRSYSTVKSWSYYFFWRCDYCFCLCDEPGPLSDRYFSLRDTLSDFTENKVVTGVRFVKDQRVFHLQLQQGELLPGGLINQSTCNWKPLESFSVSHVDIRNGYDYHELSLESRSMDLDEITAENDSLVVTGARFRVLDKHLNLEVRFSSYNFTTGRLQQPEANSVWLGNNPSEPREKLLLNNPNLPRYLKLKSVPISKNNQFMEFISSSIDMDAAQSTVPFIDVQDVVTDPPMPISGLGIYHKGLKGSGGFFAPKIVTFNLLKKLLSNYY